MNSYLVVFIGSGLGGMLRHAVNVFVPRLVGAAFPYHTLTVNIVGSFVLGLLAGYFATKGDPGQSWRLFLTTGVVGGFTTFSAFSLDTAVLYERGEPTLAVVYVLASVGLSLAALFAGLFIMRTV
ncbi:MAG: fluoride efflux transporter CrcB [Burkholderiales bacterium]|nr:fluoride efflux transporter CrcB [Burkholderiales bacterium]